MTTRAAVTAGELMVRAAEVLRRRRSLGRYPELSAPGVNHLVNALTEAATAPRPRSALGRDEAIALAHRLLDDDHPERCELWGAAATLDPEASFPG